jgi:peptidoglycan/LPS O-acetylase OafA/YrhL
MSSPVRNLAAGSMAAAVIAAALVVSSSGSENGWKYLLAAIGAALWVIGGLSDGR